MDDARETLAEIDSRRAGTTHYEGCRRDHTGCLLAQLICEVERLREAIRRLAEQDATLSVQGGNVTVTMDATLTAEEREAIRVGIAECRAMPTVATRWAADTMEVVLARAGQESGHVPDSRNRNGHES